MVIFAYSNRNMIKEILLVGTGGFAGSVLRYLVSVILPGVQSGGFPWATFTVNGTGSLLIGIFLAAVGEGNLYFLLIAGFCGGFTTFSAFSSEMLILMRNGNYATAGLYAMTSLVICIAAVWLGILIGKIAR